MTEVAARAAFDRIRYAQCWEDADVLLAGLAIRPGDTCVGIASAGDNCLAMLTADPARVVAVDLNPTQLHCLALRVAAYRRLNHAGLLRLIGSRPADDRAALYRACRGDLADAARDFWDAHPQLIAGGIGAAGRFENYFRLFRTWALPLVHPRRRVRELLLARQPEARAAWYAQHWDTWRWRLLFRLFFSRFVMGRSGRDPVFFRHVDGPVATRILARTRHALVALDPARNPYLHWILTGTHGEHLPLALRAEHFATIRARLDRLDWRLGSLEDAARSLGGVDRWNLSDIFEYMSPASAEAALSGLVSASRADARLLYWNMLAPRSRPESLAGRLDPVPGLGERLLAEDQAFFYSRVVVEQVAG
jgi:S-adenosylmethionine-diacylglycerol 3-amino-3-carboxypropyl transferase